MKEKVLDRLVSVKSIVTLMLSCVFCYLCVTQIVSGESFTQIFLMVISFYFGVQVEKKNHKADEVEE